jgi:hypothetical protein
MKDHDAFSARQEASSGLENISRKRGMVVIPPELLFGHHSYMNNSKSISVLKYPVFYKDILMADGLFICQIFMDHGTHRSVDLCYNPGPGEH